jgi:outer membrane lipoprotein-sorting protein
MAGTRCLAAVVALTMVFPVWVAAEDTLESVEKQIIEKTEKIKSLSSRMKMVTETKGEHFQMKSTAEGTQEYARRGEKTLFRVDSKSSTTMKIAGGEETKTDETTKMISDGEYMYTLSEGAEGKRAFKMKQPQGSSNVSSREMFDFLRKDHELKLLPAEKIDGKDVWVIRAVPKNLPPETKQETRYYYLKDNGQLAKTISESKNPDGESTVTMTTSDIKIDPNLDPDRFVFKAPEGVEVVDMTAMMEAAQAVQDSGPPETPAEEPAEAQAEQESEAEPKKEEEQPRSRGPSVPRLPFRR